MLARSETRSADAQLQASLRAGLAAYTEQATLTERLAAELAASARVREALGRRDLPELEALVRNAPHVRIESAGGFHVGTATPSAVEWSMPVTGVSGKTTGRVIASLPLDQALEDRLRAAAALPAGRRLLVGRGLSFPVERAATVKLHDSRFRVLASRLPGSDPAVEIAVLTPQGSIQSARRAVWLRVLAALAASLAVVGLVAHLVGRSIVKALKRLVEAARGIAAGNLSQRIPAKGGDEFARLGRAFNEMAEQLQARLSDLQDGRRRLRDATIRFGEALASTHDADQLLRSIVETAVELTRAGGGHVKASDGHVVEVGDPNAGPARLELPLQVGATSFGSLVLLGPEFTIRDLESASLLVGHAVVALENARLHRILEQQALVDGVTGVANRRAADRALAAEMPRSLRLGTPLSLVFADLDGFKSINDRFGHPAGDVVLREVASVLEGSVRETDLAARWGGEEFCLILPGTDAAGAGVLAERLRMALADRTILTADGTPVQITASFGVASNPPSKTAKELVSSADTALYEAKRAGKNRIVVAHPDVAVA